MKIFLSLARTSSLWALAASEINSSGHVKSVLSSFSAAERVWAANRARQVALHVLGGVHLYALQHNERLSFLHLIAFTDEDGVDDTAFKVLDGLRSVSILTFPGATMAPLISPNTAHVPSTPKNRNTTRPCRMILRDPQCFRARC